MKALSERVQNLWLNVKVLQQTNQQTDRAKTICPRYRYWGHKNQDFFIRPKFSFSILNLSYFIIKLYMYIHE